MRVDDSPPTMTHHISSVSKSSSIHRLRGEGRELSRIKIRFHFRVLGINLLLFIINSHPT